MARGAGGVVGLFENGTLNISVKGGQLIEGGNLSRDGYYLRKYGV